VTGSYGIETLRNNILILSAGGAWLFAALDAKRVNPELDVTIAVMRWTAPTRHLCAKLGAAEASSERSRPP
jgi:hypothetical protein